MSEFRSSSPEASPSLFVKIAQQYEQQTGKRVPYTEAELRELEADAEAEVSAGPQISAPANEEARAQRAEFGVYLREHLPQPKPYPSTADFFAIPDEPIAFTYKQPEQPPVPDYVALGALYEERTGNECPYTPEELREIQRLEQLHQDSEVSLPESGVKASKPGVTAEEQRRFDLWALRQRTGR